MIYSGACHCGAVQVEYTTDAPVVLRRDGCSFCTSRGVKSASDPTGRLLVKADVRLVRYRFGHKTADFLLCPDCGSYVATLMQAPEGTLGVLNVVGAGITELMDEPAELISLDGEDPDARIERRRACWTPMELHEPVS